MTVMLETCVRELPYEVSVRIAAALIEVLRRFPQAVQANTGVVS